MSDSHASDCCVENAEISWYIRCLARGVSRHCKVAFLHQRYVTASASGNVVESAAIYSYLSAMQILEPRVRVPFNFNALSDRDCILQFHFHKREIEQLLSLMRIGDICTRERTRTEGVEALCIMLWKLSVPVRWADMETLFGRLWSGLSNIFLHVMSDLCWRFNKLLNFNKEYAAQNVQRYADAIFDSGAHIHNVWCFIDGTVRGICRPVPRNQRRDGQLLSQQSVYNGHKRKHAVKYQTLVTPDGLITHVYGPFPGRNHDLKMCRESQISSAIRGDVRFHQFRVFGDMAYGCDDILDCPFGGALANMTSEQQQINKSMSEARVSVEWRMDKLLTTGVRWISSDKCDQESSPSDKCI